MRFLYFMLSNVLITGYMMILTFFATAKVGWDALPDTPEDKLIFFGPLIYAWVLYNLVPATRYRRVCRRHGLFTPALWIHTFLMIALIAEVPQVYLKATLFQYTGMAIVGFALGFVHSTFWPHKPWTGGPSFFKTEAEFRKAHPNA